MKLKNVEKVSQFGFAKFRTFIYFDILRIWDTKADKRKTRHWIIKVWFLQSLYSNTSIRISTNENNCSLDSWQPDDCRQFTRIAQMRQFRAGLSRWSSRHVQLRSNKRETRTLFFFERISVYASVRRPSHSTAGVSFVFQADLSCQNTKQSVGAIYTRTNFVTLKYVTDSWGTISNGFRLVITAVKDPSEYTSPCDNSFVLLCLGRLSCLRVIWYARKSFLRSQFSSLHALSWKW